MFRHFVVIALAITALLALFATGERRQQFEEKVAEKQQEKKLKAIEMKMAKEGKGGNTGLVFKDNRRHRTYWPPDPGFSEQTYDNTFETVAPQLGGGKGPRLIDVPSTAGQPSAGATVAPPGMTSQAIEAIKKKKKKLLSDDGMPHRRPPPTEESLAED